MATTHSADEIRDSIDDLSSEIRDRLQAATEAATAGKSNTKRNAIGLGIAAILILLVVRRILNR
ncbi:hypothetical protein SAMN05892883_1197 [Jatrophihabitans sp. GAS493]|uniref:hypothetical protein n=1 Tax=Jatrophihabitans sp. GAS493 TaxID=1907575 RepID=UPI000BB80ED4|nr:hypothetical protein [Jatrophihabitans sp. GAS493]SOD71718.1 hypothetical protein SAMN05892883_1197 [Jatrophihabitans sp. GAS493]